MRRSNVWCWGAVAALTVGLLAVAVPTSAAPPPSSDSPVPTATAAVTGDSAVVDYSINRAAKQIRQPVSCTLDGHPVDCGRRGPSSKKLSSYSTTLTGLESGMKHAFQVTFTLADGGTASATVQFAIAPPPTPQQACIAQGGSYYPDYNFYRWFCESAAPPHFPVGAQAILTAACSSGNSAALRAFYEGAYRLTAFGCRP